jgi:hypothetical protein
MNLNELKNFAKEYLTTKGKNWQVFNISETLSFSIATEIPPYDIDFAIIGTKGRNEFYDNESKFEEFLKEYKITTEDLKFAIEEQMLKEI